MTADQLPLDRRRVALGFVAAALSLPSLVTLLLFLSGLTIKHADWAGSPAMARTIFLTGLMLSAGATAFVALPAFLVLRRVLPFRWWSSVVAGGLIGVVLLVGIAAYPSQFVPPFQAEDIVGLAPIAGVAALLGAVGGEIFWLVARPAWGGEFVLTQLGSRLSRG